MAMTMAIYMVINTILISVIHMAMNLVIYMVINMILKMVIYMAMKMVLKIAVSWTMLGWIVSTSKIPFQEKFYQ